MPETNDNLNSAVGLDYARKRSPFGPVVVPMVLLGSPAKAIDNALEDISASERRCRTLGRIAMGVALVMPWVIAMCWEAYHGSFRYGLDRFSLARWTAGFVCLTLLRSKVLPTWCKGALRKPVRRLLTCGDLLIRSIAVVLLSGLAPAFFPVIGRDWQFHADELGCMIAAGGMAVVIPWCVVAVRRLWWNARDVCFGFGTTRFPSFLAWVLMLGEVTFCVLCMYKTFYVRGNVPLLW